MPPSLNSFTNVKGEADLMRNAESPDKQPNPFDKLDLWDLLKQLIAPTIVVGALAYYVGWSMNAAYYYTFGLDPSFIDKDIQQVMASAWLELFAAIIGLIIAVAISQLVDSWYDIRNMSIISWMRLVALFWILVVLSFASAVAALFVHLVVRVVTWSVACLGAMIAFLWLTILVGEKLGKAQDAMITTRTSFRAFRLLFPSPRLYMAILVLAIVLLLARIGVWHGYVAAWRDTGIDSNLQPVTLYSKEPLPLPGSFDPLTGLYRYADLRLIDSTNDRLYLLRWSDPITLSQPMRDFHTYVVTKRPDLTLLLAP